MDTRQYTDTDGNCFADTKWGCGAMVAYETTCGTYQCPFYKPVGCEDWIRIDGEDSVRMYPPEEYYKVRPAQIVREARERECQ